MTTIGRDAAGEQPVKMKQAFIVRFFRDGGFRVEGPFPPDQVQQLVDTGDCQWWLRDWAQFAVWGNYPNVNGVELFALAPTVSEIAQRRSHKHYQVLKANHYRIQHRKQSEGRKAGRKEKQQ